MDIEELRQEIISVWHEINPDIKISVAYAWEKREQLGHLKTVVQATEPDVLRILKNIPRLEKDSAEYKEHAEEFVRLIINIEPNDSWYARVHSDLEHILQELEKIRISLKERWILSPDVRKQLEDLRTRLERFLRAYHSFIEGIQNLPRVDELRQLYQNLLKVFENIGGILSGKINPSSASSELQKISLATLRDCIITSIRLLGNEYEIFHNARLRPLIDEMMEICEVKVVLPELGTRVDPSIMEYEPTGVISQYPRGTVARVERVGYFFSGRLFSPARVIFSEGPPN